jgi:hypothetical protein
VAAAAFLLHQLAQYYWQLSNPFLDQYLDAFLCLPLLFGLWNWERQQWWDLPSLGHTEIILASLLAFFVFEWLYPRWSPVFVGDYKDGLAYSAGSLLFWWINRSAYGKHQKS